MSTISHDKACFICLQCISMGTEYLEKRFVSTQTDLSVPESTNATTQTEISGTAYSTNVIISDNCIRDSYIPDLDPFASTQVLGLPSDRDKQSPELKAVSIYLLSSMDDFGQISAAANGGDLGPKQLQKAECVSQIGPVSDLGQARNEVIQISSSSGQALPFPRSQYEMKDVEKDHKSDYPNAEWTGHLVAANLNQRSLSSSRVSPTVSKHQSPQRVQELQTSSTSDVLSVEQALGAKVTVPPGEPVMNTWADGTDESELSQAVRNICDRNTITTVQELKPSQSMGFMDCISEQSVNNPTDGNGGSELSHALDGISDDNDLPSDEELESLVHVDGGEKLETKIATVSGSFTAESNQISDQQVDEGKKPGTKISTVSGNFEGEPSQRSSQVESADISCIWKKIIEEMDIGPVTSSAGQADREQPYSLSQKSAARKGKKRKQRFPGHISTSLSGGYNDAGDDLATSVSGMMDKMESSQVTMITTAQANLGQDLQSEVPPQTSSLNSDSHVRRKNTREQFQCTSCGVKFTDLNGDPGLPLCMDCRTSFVEKWNTEARSISQSAENFRGLGDKLTSPSEIPDQNYVEDSIPDTPGEKKTCFSCSICGVKFRSKQYLGIHTQLHSDPDPHICNVCQTGFVKKCHLFAHWESRHMGNNSVNCGPKRRSKKSNKDKKSRKSPRGVKGPWFCSKCGVSHSQKVLSHRHERLHSDNDPYMCGVCGIRFVELNHLDHHSRGHAPEDRQRCFLHIGSVSKPKKPRPQTTPVVNMKTVGAGQHQCYTCGKFLSSRSSLVQHIEIHTGERRYPCELCNKGFPSNARLRDHMFVHSNAKPYECSVCGKKVSTARSLGEHMFIHTGKRPFSCPTCEKTFKTSSALSRHQRTHPGQRPYVCDTCGKTFGRKYNFDDHVLTHITAKPHTCSVCGKCFAWKSTLSTHMKIHTISAIPIPIIDENQDMGVNNQDNGE